MRFERIGQLYEQHPQWSLKLLFRVMGVSRNGYALFSKRQKLEVAGHKRQRQQRDSALVLHIRATYRRSRCYSGSPRIYEVLRGQGIRTSRKRVACLMKQHRLADRSRSRRRITTADSNHVHPVAANLLARCFIPQEVTRPIAFGVATSPTCRPKKVGFIWRQSKSFSCGALGWAPSETLEAALVAAAWET